MAEVPADQVQKPKPKRSMAERVVVQGGIGVLLIVVAIEGISHLRQKSDFEKLTSEVKASDESKTNLTKPAVEKLIGGRKPDKVVEVKASAGMERYDVYYYGSLLKQRVVCVHYSVQGKDGEEPDVPRSDWNSSPEVQEKLR